ncbi:MAG: hypothetical protein ACFCGT_04235 [Sandaracinaceae bacterium]
MRMSRRGLPSVVVLETGGSRGKVDDVIEFFRAGGWPMFVVLLFSVLTIAGAVQVLLAPRAQYLEMTRALSVATVLSIVSGVCTDLAAVFSKVPANPAWAESPDLALIVMTGLGESLAPAVLGLPLLSIAWLLLAAGLRRLEREA